MSFGEEWLFGGGMYGEYFFGGAVGAFLVGVMFSLCGLRTPRVGVALFEDLAWRSWLEEGACRCLWDDRKQLGVIFLRFDAGVLGAGVGMFIS